MLLDHSVRRLLATLLTVSVLLDAGCEPIQEAQDLPSWTQWSERFASGAMERHLLVIALDDTHSADAARLRRDVERALGRTLGLSFSGLGHEACAWTPLDWCAVVVLPSASGQTRFIGPMDDPNLCIQTLDAPVEAAADFAARVAQTTASHLASREAPYRPIAALTDVLSVLARRRAPETLREAALADLAGTDPAWVHVVLATSLDDTDDSPLPTDAFPTQHPQLLFEVAVVAPSGEVDACPGDVAGAPRIEVFGGAGVDRFEWPCDPAWSTPPFQRFWGFWLDGGLRCIPRRVVRDASGHPACRAEVVLFEPDARCEAARGWYSPGDPWGSLPQVRQGPRGEEHVCSLRALEGQARAECESEREPLLCESGYCITEDPELLGLCPPNEPARVRLQGGALPEHGYVELTCDLE